MKSLNTFNIENDTYRKLYLSYRDQKRRCCEEKHRSFFWCGKIGICVEYTFEELISWFKCQNIIKNWSIGRIDHSKNYTISNIELVSKSSNSKERIFRIGTPKDKIKTFVYKNGCLIASFDSALSASNKMNLHHGHLIECLNGKRKTHKGLTFKAGG